MTIFNPTILKEDIININHNYNANIKITTLKNEKM
jgi:hypothetical protein